MAKSRYSRSFLGITGDRWVAFIMGMPFLAFPISAVISQLLSQIDQPSNWFALAHWLVFSALYGATWLANPVCPPRSKLPLRLGVFLFLLVLLQITDYFLTSRAAEVIYFIPFAAAATTILPPLVWAISLDVVLLVLAFSQALWSSSGSAMEPLLITITMVIIGAAVRTSIIISTRVEERSLALIEAGRLSLERERSRISADLHDVLGQNLTALSVKAELVMQALRRALPDIEEVASTTETAATAEATAGAGADCPGAVALREASDIHRLSREMLADVRRVVEQTRAVSIASELDSAHLLLEAAGVRVHVVASQLPAGPFAQLAAYVVREGASNVVHHSWARDCWITITPSLVQVRDNGRGQDQAASLSVSGVSFGEVSSGRGLKGLAARGAGVAKISGEVVFAPDGSAAGWELRAQALQ